MYFQRWKPVYGNFLYEEKLKLDALDVVFPQSKAGISKSFSNIIVQLRLKFRDKIRLR